MSGIPPAVTDRGDTGSNLRPSVLETAPAPGGERVRGLVPIPFLLPNHPAGGGGAAGGLGMSKRALLVVDGEGTIRWSYLSPIEVNPGVDGILTALDSMAAGVAA